MTPKPVAFMEITGSGSVLMDRSEERGETAVVVNWTADANGSVRLHIDTPITGVLHTLRTKPSGSAVPTDLYDITWEDALERDILSGNGANRSMNTVQEVPLYTVLSNAATVREVDGPTVFKVANAGANKSGVAVLRLKDRDIVLERI